MVAIVGDKAVEEKRTESQTSAIVNHISRLSLIIQQKDEQRAELARKLFDDGVKSEIVEGYKAIEVIKNVYSKLKRYPALFFEELRKRRIMIRDSDPELSRYLDKSQTAQSVDPIIGRIYTILTTYPVERVFEHFKGYYEGYSKRLETLENRGLGIGIRDLIRKFLLIYGKRKTQINRVDIFTNNVEQWNTTRGKSDEFIKELQGYVDFLKELHDKKIDELLNSPDVQRILVYDKELEFLKDVLRRVSIGGEEATWKDFLNVYSNMKQIIKALESRYFDKAAADELQNCYRDTKNFGQQPEAWEREFKKLIYEHQQEKMIIDQAKHVALWLFRAVIVRINKVLEMEIKSIVKEMRKVVGKVKETPRKTMNILMRVVKKKKKLADVRIKDLRQNYINKVKKGFHFVMEFMGDSDRFFRKLDIDGFERAVRRLHEHNRGIIASSVGTSRRFTNQYPNYDFAVGARLIGLASGLRANSDGMLEGAVRIRRSAVEEYESLVEKADNAIKVIDSLIADLISIFIRNKEVRKNG